MPSYYCHQCERPVRLRDGDFICAVCGSDFIEEMPLNNQMDMPQSFASLIGSMLDAEGRNNSSNTRAGTSSDAPLVFGGIRFSSEGHPNSANVSLGRASQSQDPSNTGNEPTTDAVITSFLNQLLSNLTAQGAHIQFQISRDPNSPFNVLQRPVSDYVFGDGGLDEVVTQLLNQFEGGSTPVDPKYLGNLPMSPIDEKVVNDKERCPTCMETFVKDEVVAKLDCRHCFHRDCIIPWFRRHNTCPVCRHVVDASKWHSNDPLEELD